MSEGFPVVVAEVQPSDWEKMLGSQQPKNRRK